MPPRRPLALFALLCPLLAPAAPVPKEMPAEMVRRLYGEVADKDAKVTCEGFGKDGLRLTVPKDAGVIRWPRIGPTLARDAEGDFVLTVRVRHVFDRDADPYPGFPREVQAGVVAVGGDGRTRVFAGFHAIQLKRGEFCPAVGLCADGPRGGAGWVEKLRGSDTDPVFLRLTRLGDEFSVERSDDGEKWMAAAKPLAAAGIGATVKVGPAVGRDTGEGYIAEFDRYELKQPPAKAGDGAK